MSGDDNLYRSFDLSRLVALESALPPGSAVEPDGLEGETVTAVVAPPTPDADAAAADDDNRYRSIDLSRLVALESALAAGSAVDSDGLEGESEPAVVAPSTLHAVDPVASVVAAADERLPEPVADKPDTAETERPATPPRPGADADGGQPESADVLSDWVARLSIWGPVRAADPVDAHQDGWQAPGAAAEPSGPVTADEPRVDPLVSNPAPARADSRPSTSGFGGLETGADQATADDQHRVFNRAAAPPWRSSPDDRAPQPAPAGWPPSSPRRRLGYQPGLDGLRAVSVIAVVLYHGGFGWIHGGFLGVEVFFVVSGYLITTLLIEEQESSGSVNLAKFWIRRGRRLLPALFAMLLAVSVWVLSFGTPAQQADLRRNLPWSIFYVANWGQIVGEVPYFQSGDPPLLRHLWSLAVEEQWYVVWPLVFIALSGLARRGRVVGWLLAGVGGAMVIMLIVQSGSMLDDPINFNYLSTITRSGGLLLGAAGAFVWRPWRSSTALRIDSSRLDMIFGVAAAGLVVSFLTAELTAGWMYPWGLTLVSLLSLVCVLMIVHPAATGRLRLVDSPAMVAIGKRSYGLYLWHWPVFVLVGATSGSWVRFVAGLVIAVPLTELSYRYVELPIRSQTPASGWLRPRPVRVAAAVAVVAVFAVTVNAFRGVGPYDAAVGDQEVAFALAPTAPTQGLMTSATPPAVALPSVLIVGDSQGHSLIANQPDGVEAVLALSDGTIDGCSVYDTGTLISQQGFELETGGCSGWAQRWADAAQQHQPDVALVVLGAWDSLDIITTGQWYRFATPERDALFLDGVNAGLDAMSASVGTLAVLEVPCMRPIAVDGSYTPPLPERADDTRTAHINDLLRQVASSRTDTTFIEGPDEWCSDPTISDNPAYRWDGVHVYQLGANLMFETTVPALLDLAQAQTPAVVPAG